MNYLTITYTTAVFTPAGWRPETVTARAKSLSPKRAQVVEVMDIGENGNAGYASRTGAKRQQYSVGLVADRETGKIKNLSACEIISTENV